MIKQKKYNKRHKIEVYFILYLAALILLLPEDQKKSDINNQGHNQITNNSYLQVEKSVLNCKISLKGGKLIVADIDSINNILLFGDVYSINYNFEFENQNQKYSKISNDDKNSFFTFKQLKNDIIFKWKPNIIKEIPTSYIVKVTANAIKKNNNQLQEFILKTQFVINVVLDNNSLNNNLTLDELLKNGIENNSPNLTFSESEIINNINSTSNSSSDLLNPNNRNINNINNFNNSNNQNQNFEQNNGSFDISAENNIIKSISYNKWKNFIYFYNLNPTKELLNKPEIRVNLENNKDEGFASIAEINDKGILLEGKTPGFSNMKVTFSIKRKSDRKEAEIEFIVKPIPISKPSFAKLMYPEKNYLIKPNLPILTSEQVKLYLKDQDKIRYSSNEGGDFIFVANQSDTNKTLQLERYVGKELIGEKYNIKVVSYPNPEIIEILKINDNNYQVKTKSYGIYQADNNIVSKILSDDFITQELVGKYRFEPDENYKIHFQTFNLKLKSTQKELKEISIKISDKRGFLSPPKRLPA